MNRRLAIVMGAALACAHVHAADAQRKTEAKSVTPDLDFLEYLGTLESDEDNWTDVVNVELPSRPKQTKAEAEAKRKSEAEAAAKRAGDQK